MLIVDETRYKKTITRYISLKTNKRKYPLFLPKKCNRWNQIISQLLEDRWETVCTIFRSKIPGWSHVISLNFNTDKLAI